MTLFTTNYADVQEGGSYSPLPTGEYEMIIAKVSEKATPNGKESMQFDLIVRNDLKAVKGLENTNAQYADRHVFHDEWKRNMKDGSYRYEQNNFMYYLKAAGIPEGTAINSLEELFQLLMNKPVRVYVKKETNVYKGEEQEQNKVAPWGFKASEYQQVNHQFKEKQEQAQPQAQNIQPAEEIDYGF